MQPQQRTAASRLGVSPVTIRVLALLALTACGDASGTSSRNAGAALRPEAPAVNVRTSEPPDPEAVAALRTRLRELPNDAEVEAVTLTDGAAADLRIFRVLATDEEDEAWRHEYLVVVLFAAHAPSVRLLEVGGVEDQAGERESTSLRGPVRVSEERGLLRLDYTVVTRASVRGEFSTQDGRGCSLTADGREFETAEVAFCSLGGGPCIAVRGTSRMVAEARANCRSPDQPEPTPDEVGWAPREAPDAPDVSIDAMTAETVRVTYAGEQSEVTLAELAEDAGQATFDSPRGSRTLAELMGE